MKTVMQVLACLVAIAILAQGNLLGQAAKRTATSDQTPLGARERTHIAASARRNRKAKFATPTLSAC